MRIIEKLQDTADKLEIAKTALAAAEVDREQRLATAQAARDKASAAQDQINAGTKQLSRLKIELGNLLLDGADGSDAQHKIRDMQTKLEGLRGVFEHLNKQADELDTTLLKNSHALAQALSLVSQCEFSDLVSRYAKIVAPALPLAAQIRAVAGRHGIGGLDLSGLLIDPRNPTIGSYRLFENGVFGLNM